MDQVRLPDLEVIKRFSIAVRREHASVEEVIEALRADLDAVSRARGRSRARPSEPAARAERTSSTPARSSGAPARTQAKPAPRSTPKTLGRVTPNVRAAKARATSKTKAPSRGARRR